MEIKEKKKLIAIYNQCKSMMHQHYDPLILQDNKGVVRRVIYHDNNHYSRIIDCKIAAL